MFSLKDLLVILAPVFTAVCVLLLSPILNEFMPPFIRNYIISIFKRPNQTLIIEERHGLDINQIYKAATTYLRTKVSSSTNRLKVSKTVRQSNPTFDIVMGEEVLDSFHNIELEWKHLESGENRTDRQKFFELTFEKSSGQVVQNLYLNHVLSSSAAINEDVVLKIYTRDCRPLCGSEWGSATFVHPATFENLAMDPEVKRTIKEDLNTFVDGRNRRMQVSSSWKRVYWIYGPSGTGKSSLIAAMANYLKFDIYELNVSDIRLDSNLRSILLSTSNRSIMVFEDLDFCAESAGQPQLTRSGLLNFIDGLWLNCGDERIFVFTTNHKDQSDRDISRLGRIDKYVFMSYCNMDGFKLLASNYLNLDDHPLYGQIEGFFLQNARVTPAEICGELLKGYCTDETLGGLVRYLQENLQFFQMR